MRKLFRDKRGAGFLGAIILLIGVMMAAIIGSIVFFAFTDGTDIQQTDVYTGSISGAVDIFIPLESGAASDAQFIVTRTNGTGDHTVAEGATGYEYIEANNTIRLDAVELQADDTQVTIEYFDQSHDTTASIIGYAITVFAMLAIIPLIMVGGLMLRSLGFLGGNEGI